MLWLRLGDDVQPVHGGMGERLHTARGPANERAVHLRGLAQAEVEPAVVLAREPRAPVHNLELARPAREEEHLRPDGAAVRARAHELERDPVAARRNAVLVDQRRLALVRDHDVEYTAIEQIRQGDGAAVVLVGHTYGGGDVGPPRQAVVHQHARPLVAGEAGGANSGPAACVLEHVPVGAGDLGHRVPVALRAVAGDVAVYDEQFVASVVVQVAELRAPGPPRVGDDPLGGLLEPAQLRQEVEAQVVAVKQVAPLRDVGHEGVHAPAIQHIAERGRHAALGVALQARPAQDEAPPVVVQVQLFGSVVVRQEQIGPAVAVEVRRGDREGPACASHAHPIGHVLEPPIPEVMKQPVLASVRRELEAVLHDARGLQVPEIDVGAEVPCHVQIEQTVPIVVDPHGRVAVHPLPQSRLRGDVFEVEVAQVLEELEVAPLVDQQVLEPVIVVVAPYRTHRHAFPWPIHVRDAGGRGDVDERAVAAIQVQRVGVSEPAVREIEIGPSVVVHVGDRDRCAQRAHQRSDVVELWVEGGSVMHEPDAHLRRDVGEMERRRPCAGASGAIPAAVQHDYEDDGGQERHSDDGASPRPGRGNHGVKVIHLSARSAPVIFPPVQTRNLGSVALLLLAACHGAAPGADQARSDSALTARTWGLAYLQQQQLPRAEAEFRKVVTLAPEQALGYADLGLVYLREGRTREAEAQLQRAAALDSSDSDVGLMLADVYRLTGREAGARGEIDRVLRRDSTDIRALYALARLAARSADPAERQRRESLLRRVVTRAPANIVARLELVDLLLARGSAGAAAGELEALQRQLPQLPREAAGFYQGALERLGGTPGSFVGYPVLTFNSNMAVPRDDPRAVAAAIRFTDVTAGSGLEVVEALPDSLASSLERGVALAVGDYDDDETEDLFVAFHLFRGTLGRFVETSAGAGLAFRDRPVAAAFGDFDNDGRLDLYVATTGRAVLLRNQDGRTFRDVAASAGLADSGTVTKALFWDLDHDGDLDLLLATPRGNRVYRNNLDGTFREMAAPMGLAMEGGRDAAAGDFDGDGRTDLVVLTSDGHPRLFHNLGQGRFEDVTAASGLAAVRRAGAVAVGDYDNDGFLDLFLTSLDGSDAALYHNRGDGTFQRDARSDGLRRKLAGVVGLDAAFFDFDNDGRLDLVVVGKPATPNGRGRGVLLFRNDAARGFEDFSSILPDSLRAGRAVAVADIDQDGDLDLIVVGWDGRPRVLRNDGGNVNQYVDVRLVALRQGSGKNNAF